MGNSAEKKIKGLCGWVEGGMEQRQKEIRKLKKKKQLAEKETREMSPKGLL